jgi:multiple sugar transport system permease protein
MASQALPVPAQVRRPRLTFRSWEAISGWLMVSPWIIGFLLFTVGPMIASIAISFTRWDLLRPPSFIGLDNYVQMISGDPKVALSMKVTTVYAFVSVPLSVAVGLLLALLLNEKIKLQSLARTIFYLPSVVSGVAVALLWRWIFAADFGLINSFLAMIGLQGPSWLSDTRTALPALIIMSLWGVGGGMIIYLAGLQNVPTELYEAAELDGASSPQRFWTITVPMISPVIFFQSLMGLIGALQTFTQAYIMTDGGPKNATLFYLLYLYRNAFQYFNMGYASALAWLLFVYIMVITLLMLRSSASWVYYEGGLKR